MRLCYHRGVRRWLSLTIGFLVAFSLVGSTPGGAQDQRRPSPPPVGVPFDYQIGGSYTPDAAVGVVSRDWHEGEALPGGYSICYINAFQTQGNFGGDRPDETQNWPQRLVLRSVGDDPNWPGEFPIDIRTRAKRVAATRHVTQMIETCAEKGFDAVEFDNLDTWRRYTDLPAGQELRRGHMVDYARRLVNRSHALGLAVAQKNAAGLPKRLVRERIGFDFAVVESCGFYDECGGFRHNYGRRLLFIEYTDEGFARACEQVGGTVPVILRDQLIRHPSVEGYVYERC